ncbi:MAG: NDP-hexose 2,3-dehydratase family protein [bacterium]|nr:NDP-hexose 2,3-dehydratase family protein [bacterium]
MSTFFNWRRPYRRPSAITPKDMVERKTPYVSEFLNREKSFPFYDKRQSEQGTRFYRKRNRNIGLLVDKTHMLNSNRNYGFVPLNLAVKLLYSDYLLNSDLRSVLFFTIGSLLVEAIRDNSVDSLKFEDYPLWSKGDQASTPSTDSGRLLARLSSHDGLGTRSKCFVKLNQLRDWEVTSSEIFCHRPEEFRIQHFKVHISNREISTWDQPLIVEQAVSLVTLFCRMVDGRLRFLFQLHTDLGTTGGAELSGLHGRCSISKVQLNCLLDSLVSSHFGLSVEYEVLADTFHSEEGGRFYQARLRHVLVMLKGTTDPGLLPSECMWLSFPDVLSLSLHSYIFSNEVRGLLAMVLGTSWSGSQDDSGIRLLK